MVLPELGEQKAYRNSQEPLIKSSANCVAGKMRRDARRATKVVARLRPVSPRPACGSSRTSSALGYRTQPSAPLPAPRCARPSPGRTTTPRSATPQTLHFTATRRDGVFRAVSFVAWLAKGNGHWLHLASRIPSRKASIATAWDLIRGSMAAQARKRFFAVISAGKTRSLNENQPATRPHL
jgi:hypothetical protein